MISVIVPVYNVEEYLGRCVDSILSQTYGDFELILVNDGSCDSSGRICDDYAELDSRIRVIHKANGGIGSARNAGLEIAKGEYISFLDSDDWIELDFFEVLLNLLLKYDADISQVFFIQETRTKKDRDFAVVRKKDAQVYDGRDVMGNLFGRLTGFRTTVVWNKLYRRELFDGIRIPENMVFEDEACIHEILYRARRLVVNDSTLYHYTWRDNSLSNQAQPLKYLDLVKAGEMRLRFFAERQEEEYYLEALNRYFKELLRTGHVFYFSKVGGRENISDKGFDNSQGIGNSRGTGNSWGTSNSPGADNSRGTRPSTTREGYLGELKGKLAVNMEDFKRNPYMWPENRLLLAFYQVNPALGFWAFRVLGQVKAWKKGLRQHFLR